MHVLTQWCLELPADRVFWGRFQPKDIGQVELEADMCKTGFRHNVSVDTRERKPPTFYVPLDATAKAFHRERPVHPHGTDGLNAVGDMQQGVDGKNTCR